MLSQNSKKLLLGFLLGVLLGLGPWACLSSSGPGGGTIGPQEGTSAPGQAIGSGDQMTPNAPVGVVAPGTGGNTDLGGDEKSPFRVEKETSTEDGVIPVVEIKGTVEMKEGDIFKPCCGGRVIRVVDLMKNQFIDTRLSEKKTPQGPLDPILSEGHFEVNFNTVKEASFKFFLASEDPGSLVLDSIQQCGLQLSSSWKEIEAIEVKIKIPHPQPAEQGSGRVQPQMQAAEPSK